MRPAAVIGNVSRDIVDGSPPRVGGGAFYGAHGLRLIGARAQVVTKCEEADRHALIRPVLALGVPVAWRASSATAGFGLRYEGQTRHVEITRVGEPWAPEDVAVWVGNALRGAAWVHLAALTRTDFPAETVATLARGRRLSLDAQGLMRPAQEGPVTLDKNFDARVLGYLTVLKLAEDEAETLLDHVDEQALRELGVPEILVSLGSRGALHYARGRLQRVAVRPLQGVDPTGAGDVLCAAYVSCRALGQPPPVAARRAAEAAAAFLARRRRR
jgi:sugar/nucleoside kinase (ribokinase family)